MVGTTYGYHYGGPVRRGDRYRNVTSRSGLQMRHSGNTKQASSVQFKTEYDKLDATAKSALDKFTNKPDSQLTSAERDSLYRIEPWFYLQYVRNNYPNKVEFHKDRLKSFNGFKRNIEENGLVPKESSETKPETQYAEQAAQDMIDSSKPAKKDEQPAWVTIPWRETVNRIRDRTPEANSFPEEALESATNSNSLWDFPELAVSKRGTSRTSNYLNDAYARKVESDNRKQASRINLDGIRPDGFSRSPARYNSFSSILGRNEPLIYGLTTAGALGLSGLGLYGKYALQQNDEELAQTQVPYRMELEPVNEDIPQAEPTLEQQYAAQDIPSFSTRINNLFDLYQQQEQLMREKEIAASKAYQDALEMGQRIATGTGYAPELNEENFVFPQKLPDENSNIKTANLKSPDGGEVPQELNKLTGVKSKVIKDTPNGSVILNDPNHRKTRNVQNNSTTPEQAAAKEMVNQYAGIPIEVAKAKNSGYTPPFLTTDAIWDRVRKAGLSSPEQAIRSGLFTPAEVRYITENDLWRYR